MPAEPLKAVCLPGGYGRQTAMFLHKLVKKFIKGVFLTFI